MDNAVSAKIADKLYSRWQMNVKLCYPKTADSPILYAPFLDISFEME